MEFLWNWKKIAVHFQLVELLPLLMGTFMPFGYVQLSTRANYGSAKRAYSQFIKALRPPPVGKCTLATWKIGCSRQNGTYQIFDYYSAKIRDKVRFNYFSVLIKWSCFWCHSKLITTIFFSFKLEFKLLSNNCQLKCWKWLTFSWIINSNPKTLRTCTWSCFLKWPTDVRFPIIFAHDIPHSLTL